MRSDTAFFSADVISRRFLCGLTRAGSLRRRRSPFSARSAATRSAPPGGGSQELLDVGQRLDLGLEAVDFALPVGNCLCDDTHGAGE